MAKLLNELARDYLTRKLGDPISHLCLHIVTNRLDIAVAREETQQKYQSCIQEVKRNNKTDFRKHSLNLHNDIIQRKNYLKL